MHAMKRDLFRALAMLFVFLVCCLVMAVWGHQMNSRGVVIPFMTVWGLSALLWPAFALRGLRRYMRKEAEMFRP